MAPNRVCTLRLSTALAVLFLEIQLFGDAIGNDTYARTDILVVQAGQYIEWTLETDLRRSSVGVF